MRDLPNEEHACKESEGCYLRLCIAMIDDVHKPVGMHRVAYDGRELRPTLGGGRLGEVNDREVSPFY